MSVPVIAFFNNKGGVGKTSLLYHLAWMYRDLGLCVVAADLDPQSNLSAGFLDEERFEELWPDGGSGRTVYGFLAPLLEGTGDVVTDPTLETIAEGLYLIPGDLALSGAEDELSTQWSRCSERDPRAFRVMSGLWRILQGAAKKHHADVVLMDLGPNLGSINRAALVSANHVVIPVAPDLFSVQGLRNLGPTVRDWRLVWQERIDKNPVPSLDLPPGEMRPAGYIVLQHSVRLDRPVKAYDLWIQRIPAAYRRYVLNEAAPAGLEVRADPYCLATLKHFRSLVPMAQEARKPIFHLRPADGAIGSHFTAVQQAREDFDSLARAVAKATGLAVAPRKRVARQ